MRNSVLLAAVTYASWAAGQVTVDPSGKFTCSTPGGQYCASGSLQSNIIIRCTNSTGQPGNCNANLSGVPPVGSKTSALCWESSLTAGDAGCSLAGIVYADNGTQFPVPVSSSSATPSSSFGTPSATPSGSTSTSSRASSTASGSTVTPSSRAPTTSSLPPSSSAPPLATVITTTTTPQGGAVTLTTTAGGSGGASTTRPSTSTNPTVSLANGAEAVGGKQGGGRTAALVLALAAWVL